jgi:L,D-transpeptidase ErfK/SrfK
MPWGVGRRFSRGCIRLYPEDIESLFPRVPTGTKVTVVNQPVKIGWHAGELYLEVHPPLTDTEDHHAADLESTPATRLVAIIVALTTENQSSMLDWAAVQRAQAGRRGIPIRISR